MSNAPQTAKSTKGPVYALPCPHCGHKLDFRQLQEIGGGKGKGMGGGNLHVRRVGPNVNDLDVVASGTGFVEPGSKFSCERCGRMGVITSVQTVVWVQAKQIEGQVRVAQAQQQRAVQQQPKPGLLARIFQKPQRR